ncbi:protein of unknown function [Paraburkholderia dioscoreae]|uniref:Uncharacterized protein n=1 Tax=Paraburkholderia dioscoreae TaxID=2604047 RepID=A0A5Q4ZFA2_9BURK|nr:protein of unknown function [Paraburkholderia dioscoreae]
MENSHYAEECVDYIRLLGMYKNYISSGRCNP